MGRGTGEEENYFLEVTESWGFPGGSEVKNPPTNTREAGDAVSISESGGSPGGGNGNPLQHSCLKNPMTEKPENLFPKNCKESDVTEQLNTCAHTWKNS